MINPSSTPVNPGNSPSNNQTSDNTTLTYGVIVAVVAITAVVVIALFVSKPQTKTANPNPANRSQ